MVTTISIREYQRIVYLGLLIGILAGIFVNIMSGIMIVFMLTGFVMRSYIMIGGIDEKN